MLDSLYQRALLKRDEINQKISDDFVDEDVDPSSEWIPHKIEEDDGNCSIAAGDGSINKKNFMGFIFYAIDAECLVFNDKLMKIGSSEIDIIPHHDFVEDRLRNYMGIFEVKNALRALNEHEIKYLLFDGSIMGNLIRPIPMEKRLKAEVKDKIKKKYVPRLVTSLDLDLENSEVGITSSQFSEEMEEFEDPVNAMIYLESIENLLVIKKLLENERSVMGISKTSTNREYFDYKIPDMAIFDRYSREEGFSKPKPMKISKREEFPVANDFFKGLTFTIFYVRLENHKNILKFELPYKVGENELDQIKKLLGIIKNHSAEGYPLLLKKAHNDVVIKRKDLENLSKIIGFMEKSGREML
jgi:NurA-like 5'-3' nuclease